VSTTPPVFLVDALPGGSSAVLDGAEGRHAATVLRLRTGERLTLSDGRGGLADCVVRSVGRDSLEVDIADRRTVPAAQPRVLLAQALVKGDRGELAVDLATEAGVDVILPWRATRCVAKWESGPRGEKALSRWRDTARAAAKQARRPWLPEVREPVGTTALAAVAAAVARALVLHESAVTRLAEVGLPADGDVLLVVGPEGGIAPEELALLTESGATAVRLGPTVLRSSTAAAVALGALGVLTNRWT
jgi:16S rRNA (uracil1498-N3)-methyltransferase